MIKRHFHKPTISDVLVSLIIDVVVLALMTAGGLQTLTTPELIVRFFSYWLIGIGIQCFSLKPIETRPPAFEEAGDVDDRH